MSATTWTLGALSFNTGPDGAGNSWWADVPSGWNTPRSTGRVVPKAGGGVGLLFGGRRTARTLQASGQVICPSMAAYWTARNALEALADAAIAAAATLTVNETVPKSLQVRYIDGLVINPGAGSFTFVLPLVALDPVKT